MTTAVVPTDSIEGEVLDGTQFPNLYRLLDVERSAMDEWQRLSLPAAGEVLEAWEADEWKEDKQAEWDAYVAEHNIQPSWRPTTELAFIAWMQQRAERDGHEFQSPDTIRRLRLAAQCIRIIEQAKSNGPWPMAKLPQTEGAWRPAYKLLRNGHEHALPALVQRAAEIAEEQNKPIDAVAMFAARKEIWATDPQIRQIEERGRGRVDQATSHDRAIKARHQAEGALNDLVRTQDWAEVDAFHEWYLEWRRNIQVARRAIQ